MFKSFPRYRTMTAEHILKTLLADYETDKILKKAEKFIPNLRKHIIAAELATPRTMERYTSNPDGSVFGPSQIVTQSGLNRLKPETPIDGLYLCGTGTHPGGCVWGAPGQRAAAAVVNDLNNEGPSKKGFFGRFNPMHSRNADS